MKAKTRTALLTALATSLIAAQPWSAAHAGPLDIMDTLPAYPTPGGNHATFTATLPGLGLLLDGPTNRCDTDAEAGAEIAASVFTAIEAAEFACAALPPLVEDGCYAGIFVGGLASVANEIAKSQCAFHDAIIDGAEIEAAYENSATIHANLLEHDANLSEHDDNLAVHDDNLATHDTDIKARLATIEGKVDVLIGGQGDMTRLLHTPNGQRESIYYPMACGGADGCTWN